ncbi:hypothetical protein OAO87_04765 [bacterium]|nr:hypothetical protein [bacterium]
MLSVARWCTYGVRPSASSAATARSSRPTMARPVDGGVFSLGALPCVAIGCGAREAKHHLSTPSQATTRRAPQTDQAVSASCRVHGPLGAGRRMAVSKTARGPQYARAHCVARHRPPSHAVLHHATQRAACRSVTNHSAPAAVCRRL